MHRYKLTIEYDGTPYRGWQHQDGLPSVQRAIEDAFLQFTQHITKVFAAGRTDAGVHATGQVIHVDLEKEWKPGKIIEATNGILKQNGHPVCVVDAECTNQEFDARFSATQRHYRYRLINRNAPLTLDAYRAWWIRFPLDVEAMHEAAQLFLGTHDFTTFRSTECQAKSPVRSIDAINVTEMVLSNNAGARGKVINFDIRSRSFLHNQVRSMVGSLKMVGDKKWDQNTLYTAIEAKDRKACGVVAPPYGLYLTRVEY